MKFKIKNCSECAYWNSPERFNRKEFCIEHEDKEVQPPAIFKAIKKVKKERRENRITNWILVLVLFISATWSFINLFDEQKKWQIIITSSIILTLCVIYLPSKISAIVDNEKDAKAELKQLQKKLSEWIILK